MRWGNNVERFTELPVFCIVVLNFMRELIAMLHGCENYLKKVRVKYSENYTAQWTSMETAFLGRNSFQDWMKEPCLLVRTFQLDCSRLSSIRHFSCSDIGSPAAYNLATAVESQMRCRFAQICSWIVGCCSMNICMQVTNVSAVPKRSSKLLDQSTFRSSAHASWDQESPQPEGRTTWEQLGP